MSFAIQPELEARLRTRAAAEGITVEANLERVARSDDTAETELTSLALEGLQSGEPHSCGPRYWEERRRLLDKRLQRTLSL
jgi:hypothetical protein